MKEYYIKCDSQQDVTNVISKAEKMGYAWSIKWYAWEGPSVVVALNNTGFISIVNYIYGVSIMSSEDFLKLNTMKYKEGNFIVSPKGTRLKILGSAGCCYFMSTESDFNKFDYIVAESELDAQGWKLCDPKGVTNEITMDDIAKKFNVPVENIRIKDYNK